MKNGTVPAVLPAPFVATRVEKRGDLMGTRIQSGEVRALERIAPKAAQRKIARDGGAAVLPSNDVVDLERKSS